MRFLLDQGADRRTLHPSGVPLATWVQKEIRSIQESLANPPDDNPGRGSIARIVMTLLEPPQDESACRRYARILALLNAPAPGGPAPDPT